MAILQSGTRGGEPGRPYEGERLKAYVLDIKYEKAFETDVTLRVLEVFAEKGIQPPAVLHRSAVDLRPINHGGLKLAVEED